MGSELLTGRGEEPSLETNSLKNATGGTEANQQGGRFPDLNPEHCQGNATKKIYRFAKKSKEEPAEKKKPTASGG